MTSFFDKARQAAEEASRELSERAKAEAPGAQARAKVLAGQAQTGAKEMAGQARRQFVTAIERIDPGILADVIIKATALQEKANGALRQKSSAYRIAEIVVTATIPPQISFGIQRIHELEVDEPEETIDSAELIEAGAVDDAPDVVIDLDTNPAPLSDQP
ncbi:MAG: hypothetical protein ACHQ02_00065 [Candidatus Limnocylindrales bacterium]|jgi:hypothetical protein